MGDFGDVEQLKKMNQMIPELKKHGFATFTDEASQLSQTLIKEEIPVAQEPVQEQAMERHLNTFKQHMNERLANVENTMKQVVVKMNEMIAKIKEIDARPAGFKPSNDVPRSEQTSQQNQQPAQQPMVSSAPQPAPESTNQQPTSNYQKPEKGEKELQPGELDIGDYFYCGNK